MISSLRFFSIVYLWVCFLFKGYYTDNGAFYYNHTEPNTTYASQLPSLAKHFRSVSLPVRYVQMDSWWYYRGLGDGVREWTARPEIFPDGLSSFYDSLQLPLVAHNRYWSSNTVYSSQYAFLIDQSNQKALPVGNDSFWDHLLGEASRKWGLSLYEQDWMNHQTIDFQPTRTDLNVGRRWLVSMGDGAHSNGVNIQYCMALPRHALQALEVPRVTQARVSDDYEVHLVHRIPQWNIGVSSMLAHALGLAPFKDVFWSTSKQDTSPYGLRATEPLPNLQILISTLSTGPVASGDQLGQEDVTAIMRCCRTDGLILKPDRPLTPIDLILAEWAKNKGVSQGELYATHSSINDSIFPIVFAMSMRQHYTLTASSLNLPYNQRYLLWSWNNLFTITNPFSSLHVSASECNSTSFCLWHLSPVWTFDNNQVQYALLGELNKWVPVSSQRFASLSTSSNEANITLIGAPAEHIQVAVYHQALEAILILPCPLSLAQGKGILTFTPHSVYCSPSF